MQKLAYYNKPITSGVFIAKDRSEIAQFCRKHNLEVGAKYLNCGKVITLVGFGIEWALVGDKIVCTLLVCFTNTFITVSDKTDMQPLKRV